MLRSEKINWVKEYNKQFNKAKFAFVYNYAGLPSEEAGALRKAIKASGGKVCFVKNTLAKLAVKGTDFETMTGLFKNVSVLVISDAENEDDHPAIVKSLFPIVKAKKGKVVLAGGVFAGKFLNANDLTEFGNLPSREELYGRIAFLCNYPLINLADTLQRASEAKA